MFASDAILPTFDGENGVHADAVTGLVLDSLLVEVGEDPIRIRRCSVSRFQLRSVTALSEALATFVADFATAVGVSGRALFSGSPRFLAVLQIRSWYFYCHVLLLQAAS